LFFFVFFFFFFFFLSSPDSLSQTWEQIHSKHTKNEQEGANSHQVRLVSQI
jgi:hypothetical protein